MLYVITIIHPNLLLFECMDLISMELGVNDDIHFSIWEFKSFPAE